MENQPIAIAESWIGGAWLDAYVDFGDTDDLANSVSNEIIDYCFIDGETCDVNEFLNP